MHFKTENICSKICIKIRVSERKHENIRNVV